MNDDDKSPPFAGTEILTFKEGELWTACWRRFNLIATAKDEKQAVLNLLRKIGTAAIVLGQQDSLPSFGSYTPVGEKLLARWKRLFDEWHD